MEKTKRIITLLSVGVLTLGFLTACSDSDTGKVVSPPVDKTPTEEVSPTPEPTVDVDTTPSPDISANPEGVYAPREGLEDLNFIYQSDFTDTYSPEVLANLESDSNTLTHMMNGGEFTFFVQPYDGPDELRLEAVRPYLGEEAFADLTTAYEEGDGQIASSLIPQVNRDGTFTFEGEKYTIANIDDVPYSVTMTNWNDDVTFSLVSEEDVSGVLMHRYITVHYITDTQERIWEHKEINYMLQPNADGNWVISGWSATSEAMGIDSAESLFTSDN